ncbi:phosphate signaling complex protein PhoU [Ahrensia sp. R2A130]|uniref:phosphate signaling complex protein PhoU n=1 Tax=Ahrensia sp. R2A130 TaxID=744979 RepID=UPI0001E0ACF0|nr:phosphate signaling complex protein PhoU [Ahrensia sp. R2A130]EFL87747.1 phosphate transport system regulatory protein PhoU [Ahrensia sp. R2A130]
MENAHIVKSFDADLTRIENLILEMGGLVESQITGALEALLAGDEERALEIRAADKAIDALESKVDEQALSVLALRQPMATDLRSVVCALKVAGNLERTGDYAKNIAKRTVVLADVKLPGSAPKTLKRMGALVQQMVADVLNAYVAKDLAMADELILRDEEVDQIHNTLFRELLTYMLEEPRNITPCMHLLFIAKNLERMGDHVTAIAEQIHYVVTGAMPTDDRPKADQTSVMPL